MSEQIPMKAYWYGKPIEEYSKEELIDMVIQMAKIIEQEREIHAQDRRVLLSFSQHQKRLRGWAEL